MKTARCDVIRLPPPPPPSCTGDMLESGSVTYSVLHEGPLPHVLGNMDERHRLRQLQGSAAAAAAVVTPVASSDRTDQASIVTPAVCTRASARRKRETHGTFLFVKRKQPGHGIVGLSRTGIIIIMFSFLFFSMGVSVLRISRFHRCPEVCGSSCFIFARPCCCVVHSTHLRVQW